LKHTKGLFGEEKQNKTWTLIYQVPLFNICEHLIKFEIALHKANKYPRSKATFGISNGED